jgi:hypothetical protein
VGLVEGHPSHVSINPQHIAFEQVLSHTAALAQYVILAAQHGDLTPRVASRGRGCGSCVRRRRRRSGVTAGGGGKWPAQGRAAGACPFARR